MAHYDSNNVSLYTIVDEVTGTSYTPGGDYDSESSSGNVSRASDAGTVTPFPATGGATPAVSMSQGCGNLFTLAQVADVMSQVQGSRVIYHPLPVSNHRYLVHSK